MGTIVERKRKDGSVSYLAQIIKRTHSFQESKTFTSRKTAEAWIKKREREIAQALAEGKPITSQKISTATLGDAIDLYIKDSLKEFGKTKEQVLRTIQTEYDIASRRCEFITSKDIIAFVEEIHQRPNVSSAATAQNYLSHLAAVFAIAKPKWGIPLDRQAMADAQAVCKHMGITAKSEKRERRPSLAEIEALYAHFEQNHKARPDSCPMHIILLFAIFSTRRQEEITRIRWEDFEPEAKRVLVRDMKNPGDKMGNHVMVDLPDPCCAIIKSMPKTKAQIFPYKSQSLSAAFTRACHALNIEDLRFHDLRHEGTSRLFEMGYSIPQAAKVTGHRSWSSLQRYTHLNETGDRFKSSKLMHTIERYALSRISAPETKLV